MVREMYTFNELATYHTSTYKVSIKYPTTSYFDVAQALLDCFTGFVCLIDPSLWIHTNVSQIIIHIYESFFNSIWIHGSAVFFRRTSFQFPAPIIIIL